MPEEKTIETIRRIISELVSVSPSEIENTTDLFDIGFNSLLTIELVSGINHELGVELDIIDLFTSPCIEGIAEAINRRQTALL